MKINLFDFDKTGKAKITKHIKDIWYLSAILEKYGEENALKLFKVFDMVYNLNPTENPFANLAEDNKYETVLRSTYPELDLVIDLEDDLIEQALDLVGELYETPKYRAYKAIKMTYEKVVRELEFANIDLTRESGNMGEIRKALDSFEDLNKKQNESYKELEEEMEITQVKGGGQARRKIQSELD
jgi:hypothetical protein